jgi:hypothetical protein
MSSNHTPLTLLLLLSLVMPLPIIAQGVKALPTKPKASVNKAQTPQPKKAAASPNTDDFFMTEDPFLTTAPAVGQFPNGKRGKR